jgi:hypothetical protein
MCIGIGIRVYFFVTTTIDYRGFLTVIPLSPFNCVPVHSEYMFASKSILLDSQHLYFKVYFVHVPLRVVACHIIPTVIAIIVT